MKLFPSLKPDDIPAYIILNQAIQSLADIVGIKYTLPKSTDELKDAYLAVAKILRDIEDKIEYRAFQAMAEGHEQNDQIDVLPNYTNAKKRIKLNGTHYR